ncbi:MAG: hypothetical protein MO846_06335 [Candidatus Devosia symbiotica]|nr:hypothetical protein [Candidatus Devosia symbiotica]
MITANNSVTVSRCGALALGTSLGTVGFDGNLAAAGAISDNANIVNIIGSTGDAEIQDGVDVARSGGVTPTLNVGANNFSGGVTIHKALPCSAMAIAPPSSMSQTTLPA